MRRVLLVLSLIAGMAGLGSIEATAQDAISRAFAETFYAEEEISDSVSERPDVTWLEKADMNKLLEAKGVMERFFQALKPGKKADARAMLAPGLASRYSDRTALRRDRFGAEKYLSFEIIDYRITEKKTGIKLRYFLSESDRGTASIRQRAMTFERVANQWMISEFDNFDFE